jgi:hypothetical protein
VARSHLFASWLAFSLLGCGAQGLFEAPTPPAWSKSADQSLRLAGGTSCYAWLDQLGVRYERVGNTAGMSDPVRVLGPIGGIHYTSQGAPGMLCDCRLVLALDWSARTLAPLGVTHIEHSGAYVLRTTRSGRRSLHARGLAIDVHGVSFGNTTHWVQRDFQRGQGDGCGTGSAALNHVACRLRQLRLFRELITPDHDADHHDHLHLGIAELPGY